MPHDSRIDFDGRAAATLILRWILGLVFVMAGNSKIFERGVIALTEKTFIEPYAHTWLPVPLLWTLGVVIPFVELGAGLLLCLGLFTRYALVTLGVLLIVTTYGHLLLNAFFDLSGHTLNRLAFIIFLLMVPASADRYRLERVFWRSS